jgi:lipoyltransferase 1
MNLCDINIHVKMEKLLGVIGWEYLRTCPYSAEDKGKEFIGRHRGFQLINPTDQWFPGKWSLSVTLLMTLCTIDILCC